MDPFAENGSNTHVLLPLSPTPRRVEAVSLGGTVTLVYYVHPKWTCLSYLLLPLHM